MTAFKWQGNVRELQNIVRGIAVLHDGRIVTLSMLPDALHQQYIFETSAPVIPAPFKAPEMSSDISPLWKVERSAIETAIALCEGNIPRAAALLEISPSTIYRKKMLWDKYPLGAPPQDSAHF